MRQGFQSERLGTEQRLQALHQIPGCLQPWCHKSERHQVNQIRLNAFEGAGTFLLSSLQQLSIIRYSISQEKDTQKISLQKELDPPTIATISQLTLR